jgi:nicotinamidase-related amidase
MRNVVNLRPYARTQEIPTLVLLDLQQEYVASSRRFSIADVEAALDNCRLALAHARCMGFPVAFLRMSGPLPCFNPALSCSSWIPGFEPLISEMVFERAKPSCYANCEFAHAMSEGGGHFVLAGFSGEAACLATAVEAFHRGHRVTYLADASASLALNQISAPAVHETVTQLIGLYGNVATTHGWISQQVASQQTASQQQTANLSLGG